MTESRLGLLFNGLLKIPMQFLILFVGVMVFVFYQFNPPPLFFNAPALAPRARDRRTRRELQALEAAARGGVRAASEPRSRGWRRRWIADDAAAVAAARARRARPPRPDARPLRDEAARADRARRCRAPRPTTPTTSSSRFVLANLPRGLVGLAAGGDPVRGDVVDRQRADRAGRHHASSTSTGAASARDASDAPLPARRQAVHGGLGRAGGAFAAFASLLDNLIQAVNILGSLFYGTILGMFLVGVLRARVRATPVFVAALLSEALVIVAVAGDRTSASSGST